MPGNGWKRTLDAVRKIVFLPDLPLVRKLFVFSAVLVVVPMLAVSVISYTQSSEVMEKEAAQYSQQIMEQVKMHVEYYIRDIEIGTLKILNHRDMIRFLKMQTPEEVAQSGIRQSVRELLKNAAYSRGDISSITVILDNVQVVDTTEHRGKYPVTELVNEYWYSHVPQNGESMLIARFISWEDRTEPVISIVKRLVSPHTLESIGMIITDVNFKRIREIAQKASIGWTGYLYILDSQGHYVYHPDLSQLGKASHFAGAMTREAGTLQMEQDGVRHFVTYSRSPFLNWTLVSSIAYWELTQGVHVVGNTIFLTTLITLVIAYVLGIGFSSGIVRPLRRLQQLIKKVEGGDFTGRVEVKTKDEIGLLSQGFNNMVERLNALVNEVYLSKLKEAEMTLRQKEMELKVLESQVNPHFLYNALETIRGMALEKGNEGIADMSSSLARLLRYNLKKESPIVTLEEEVSFCEMYLRVQKFRFEDKLDYAVHLPSWSLIQRIAKFCLQPLVENCVVHGVEPGTRMTLIRIQALRDGPDSYIVRVSDTGAGMTEETLGKIRENLRKEDLVLSGSHIGIVNVHRRIRRLFGESYGVRIDSQLGRGTTIDIFLPYHRSMEQPDSFQEGRKGE